MGMVRWSSISSWAAGRQDHGDAALSRGDEARDRRDWDVAAQQYRLHLQDRPEDFAIWVQLGHSLKEACKFAESIEAYEQALRLDPSDADLLLNLGHIHKRMGHRDSAIFFYRRSLARDGNRDAFTELQRLGVKVIVQDGALASSDAVSSARAVGPPRWPIASLATRRARKAALSAGNDARDRRDWGDAIGQYQSYLALAPNDFAIWVQLGHAFKELGRLEQALAAYQEALRLNGADADLSLSFGHLYKLKGQRAEAVSSYRRSFELDGNEHARQELAAMGQLERTRSH